MTAELDAVVLRCQDLDETKAFYERLGIELVEERHGGGPRHYSAQLGGGVVEFYPASDRFPVDNASISLKKDGPLPGGPLTDPDGRQVIVGGIS